MGRSFSYVALLGLVGCMDAPTTPSGKPILESVAFHGVAQLRAADDASVTEHVRGTKRLTAEGDDWTLRASSANADSRHVRLDQTHDGVPVWGADLVAHVKAGTVESISGTRVGNLEGFDTAPEVALDTAIATAKAAYAAKAVTPERLVYARESQRLVIYPKRGGETRLAWHVKFFTERQAGVNPGLWNYFVDAKTGAVLYELNAIETAVQQGSGPGGNPKVRRTWTNALDVTPSGSQFAMDTPRLQTFNMNNTKDSPTLVKGPLTAVSDAAIDDAHGFAEITLNMLQDWQGFNSIDNQGFVIKSRVHYDVGLENAFWDGTQMTYGDGDTTFYPLSGDVDVVAHEINHGFTTFHSDLIYDDQSGGMNESFSDIAGTTAEFYMEGNTADFDLGRDVFIANSALRFMCDPTADGSSIDNFANYDDSLDVHLSSGISNKAFCRTARRFASGSPTGAATQNSVRRASTAWFHANAAFWTTSTGFQQACQGVFDAAGDLGFTAAEKTAIQQSWADVGVNCGSGGPGPGPGGLSIKITSPADGAEVPQTFNVTLQSEGVVSVDVALDGNKLGTLTDPPFNFSIKDASLGMRTLTVTGHDAGTNTAMASIKITVKADGNPLPGGNNPPPPPPISRDKGGCSAAGGSSGLAMAFALLAICIRRRRR